MVTKILQGHIISQLGQGSSSGFSVSLTALMLQDSKGLVPDLRRGESR